jgi:hypothetical protein
MDLPISLDVGRRKDLSKFLGYPFGLKLSSYTIDSLLIDCTKKKMEFWYSSRLYIAGRIIITNHVILASILYFVSMWSGTLQALR